MPVDQTVIKGQPHPETDRQPAALLARERHRQIISRLQLAGSVRVSALAAELNVTEETIRRDLEKLDREGKLVRIHGGAVTVETDRRDLPFDVREAVNLDKKRAIAARAVRYINEGDVIALDASSTARELAREIPDVALTVVTNSVAVAGVLAHRARVRVVATGGILDAPSLSYVGSMAEEAVARYHIRKLFLSSQGVDLERGLSVTADEHARIKRRMIDLAETSYLLADSSKFGCKAVEFFARLDEFSRIVTDTGIDAVMLETMRERGLSVDIAD